MSQPQIPQPIHVEPAYAAAGPFGGLILNSWHTAAIFTWLFVTDPALCATVIDWLSLADRP
jgi:acyl dehydratase